MISLKKNRMKLLIIILLISVIINILFYVKLNTYQEVNQRAYDYNIMKFYDYIYDIQRQMEFVIEEPSNVDNFDQYIEVSHQKVSNIVSMIFLMDVFQAEEGNNLGYLSNHELTDFFYFLMGDRLQKMSNQLKEGNVNQVVAISNTIHEEIEIIRKHLPDRKEYAELSYKELTEVWIRVIDSLPKSEKLSEYKEWVRFERFK